MQTFINPIFLVDNSWGAFIPISLKTKLRCGDLKLLVQHTELMSDGPVT